MRMNHRNHKMHATWINKATVWRKDMTGGIVWEKIKGMAHSVCRETCGNESVAQTNTLAGEDWNRLKGKWSAERCPNASCADAPTPFTVIYSLNESIRTTRVPEIIYTHRRDFQHKAVPNLKVRHAGFMWARTKTNSVCVCVRESVCLCT